MRILHFSDIHLDIPWRTVPAKEWLGKRIIGGLNLYFFRRRVFDGVAEKVDQLCAYRRDQEIDLVLSTGDFTLLGTEPEYRAVSAAVAPMYGAPAGFIAVPGNHDLYLPNTLRKRRFERHFGEAMRTDRADLCSDGEWPTVRLFGTDLAVVSVNSARPLMRCPGVLAVEYRRGNWRACGGCWPIRQFELEGECFSARRGTWLDSGYALV